MSEETIDFDGDKVTFSVRGESRTFYAADEVAAIDDEIKSRDSSIRPEDRTPGGKFQDSVDENGRIVPFTHARGDAFKTILVEHFQSRHGLTVSAYTAYAMYCKLVKVKDKYLDFFVSGPNSRPPSDSRLPTASADEAAYELLSITRAACERLKDSNSSTTESSTQKQENAT